MKARNYRSALDEAEGNLLELVRADLAQDGIDSKVVTTQIRGTILKGKTWEAYFMADDPEVKLIVDVTGRPLKRLKTDAKDMTMTRIGGVILEALR